MTTKIPNFFKNQKITDPITKPSFEMSLKSWNDQFNWNVIKAPTNEEMPTLKSVLDRMDEIDQKLDSIMEFLKKTTVNYFPN